MSRKDRFPSTFLEKGKIRPIGIKILDERTRIRATPRSMQVHGSISVGARVCARTREKTHMSGQRELERYPAISVKGFCHVTGTLSLLVHLVTLPLPSP